MSNLIPTPRVNKNGVTVIRHMKPGAVSSTKASIPSVVPLAPAKRTMKRRMIDLEKMMTRLGKRNLYPSKARNWFAASSEEEMERLDFILDNYEDMPPREVNVVGRALEPLFVNGQSTEFINETIALRQAFCSEWATNDGASTQGLEDYVYGAREAFGLAIVPEEHLTTTDGLALREAVAVTRFHYEMFLRFPRESFRPAEHDYLSHSGDSYLRFKDPVLVELLREYPDRVGDLIEVAAERKDVDPQMLRAFLEHDGHTAVSGGYL